MKLLPCGDRAILADLADATERRRLDAALRTSPLPGVVDHVPGATTLLVRVESPDRLQGVADRLRALDLAADTGAPDGPLIEIPTRYDGDDLGAVAGALGVTVGEIVRRHTAQMWTVQSTGFAPGFGYLTGDAGGLHVPRRASPRPSVPAGAVALAGEYTGVYPRRSPGGWQLIGRTDRPMWDDDADPPALLTPGTRVLFRAVNG